MVIAPFNWHVSRFCDCPTRVHHQEPMVGIGVKGAAEEDETKSKRLDHMELIKG